MLLPGRDSDARLGPTIIVRRTGGVLQRRGAGKGRGIDPLYERRTCCCRVETGMPFFCIDNN